ncbi:MAG: GNAT family N-acetyltransferase, partial [Clostridium perfringens]|nr:GNAT family N-acetyltransferase [Clostridium perfringens]
MEFRQAKISDLDQIVEIIELSKKYLKETKVDQWQDGYPAKEDLRRDIESGNSYV